VVYRKGAKSPQSEADMISLNIQVQAGSSHENRLRSLRSTNPGLTWSATNVSTPELLQGVESGNFDLTIIDFNEYKAYHTRFPKTQVAFTLSPIEYIAWAFAKGKHGELLTKANAFIEEAKHSGTIAHLSEIYYGHFETTYQDGFNSHTFSRKVNNRLPKVKQLIKQTAAKHDMDWRLLAAISYQESHWRAKAKSPTGVRGMMMLTLPTAREMGVKNRLNAEQSLDGGARYLKKILKRLPDDIQEPDRTWMALAAYNVGLGHLNDAREITEFQGGDAQRWVDVKQRLPLLEEKHWYAFTQFGYARGHEPVTYVQRVRHYYELLNWYFPDEQQPNSTSNSKTELASLKNAEPSRG
jgi:membrane-bound lytic murein transglycosylase F